MNVVPGMSLSRSRQQFSAGGSGGSMMRLGVVTPCYDPEQGSAAIAGAICRSLVALGHEVHALTGFPNYPTGRFYPGYRLRPYRYETLAGVHVHRVPLVPSHDRSPVPHRG